jgi:hypothetical protein
MSNTRFFNPRRNGAWSGIGIDRAAARSNAMHLTVTEICSDPGRSGKSFAKRPGLLACLRRFGQGGYGVVIVWAEDRLARNVADAPAISASVFQKRGGVIVVNTCQIDRGPVGGMAIDLRGLPALVNPGKRS